MVFATIFVTLPFVVREVEPVLHEIGIEQEQAAATLLMLLALVALLLMTLLDRKRSDR
jgi:ABC-type sulfate transport system permease subunit